MKKYINPNILDEGNQMELVKDNDDVMKRIVRCNNCGQLTEYGNTRMCSGFVGCDNKINIKGKQLSCYFDDLMPRVMKYKNSQNADEYNLYRTGKLYRWRDKLEE
jgi:hypothetical protein